MYSLFLKFFNRIDAKKSNTIHKHQEKTLNVNGLDIAYTDIGPKDGKLVFCVHSLLSTGRNFDFLGYALAKQNYRCIAIDLPGRGKSDNFLHAAQYVPPNYIPYCLAILDHEASGQKFCWVGVSLGGILGMMLSPALGDNLQNNTAKLGQALIDKITASSLLPDIKNLSLDLPRFPLHEKFQNKVYPNFATMLNPMPDVEMTHLILIDTGGEIPAYGMDLIGEIANLPTTYDKKEEAVAALKKRCAGWGIYDNNKIWNHLIKHNIIDQDDGTYALNYDEKIGLIQSQYNNKDFPMWHLWAGIKQPTLLVRGGKSKLLPENIVRKMHETYTGENFEEIVYENCGHAPNIMQKDHVQTLTNWIKNSEKEPTQDITPMCS